MAYYILNTNRRDDPSGVDEKTMIDEKIAAAYFGKWKNKITKLDLGDVIFLYRTGEGVIAYGTVSSSLLHVRDYRTNPKFKNEEFYKKLYRFHELDIPITPSEINQLSNHKVAFLQTLISLKTTIGKALQVRCENIKSIPKAA